MSIQDLNNSDLIKFNLDKIFAFGCSKFSLNKVIYLINHRYLYEALVNYNRYLELILFLTYSFTIFEITKFNFHLFMNPPVSLLVVCQPYKMDTIWNFIICLRQIKKMRSKRTLLTIIKTFTKKQITWDESIQKAIIFTKNFWINYDLHYSKLGEDLNKIF